jgi:hypothetical protein
VPIKPIPTTPAAHPGPASLSVGFTLGWAIFFRFEICLAAVNDHLLRCGASRRDA